MAVVRWAGGVSSWEYGWAGGTMPGSADDAVIDVAGTVNLAGYPVEIAVHSITLDDAEATFAVAANHSISVTGALVVRAGRVIFQGPAFLSGTIELAGGSVVLPQPPAANLWLNGVTWIGPLDLTGVHASAINLIVRSPISGEAASVTLNGSTLNLYQGASFDDVVLDVTGGANAVTPRAILSFGTQSSIRVTGPGTSLDLSAGAVGFPPPHVAIGGQGTIAVSGGAKLSLGNAVTDFTNTGTILLSGTESRLALAGTMSAASLGTLAVSGGWLELDGNFDNSGNTLILGTPTGFTGLEVDGVLLGGTVDNQGGSLVGHGHLDGVVWRGALALGSQASVTIDHGLTILPASGARTVIDLADDSSLRFSDDVTLAGTDIAANGYTSIRGDGALTVLADSSIIADFAAGGHVIRIPGVPVLELDLSGSSVVNHGLIQASSGTGGTIRIQGAFTNTGTVAIAGAGNTLIIVSDGFDNSGSVVASNGATLELAGLPVAGSGVLRIADSASALAIRGMATTTALSAVDQHAGLLQVLGTLDNSGTRLSLGGGNPVGSLQLGTLDTSFYSIVVPRPTIRGGTVVNAGSAALLQGTLDGVAWQGAMDIGGVNARVSLTGGFGLTDLHGGQGVLNLAGQGSQLTLGSQTLAGITIHAGAVGGEVEVVGPDVPGQSVTLDAASLLVTDVPGAGTVSLRGNITNFGTIDNTFGNVLVGGNSPFYDRGGGSYFSLLASIYIGMPLPPANFSYDDYTAANLDNRGTIIVGGSHFNVGNQGSLTNSGLIRITNGAAMEIRGGTFGNSGTIQVEADSTLEVRGTIADLGHVTWTSPTAMLLLEGGAAIGTVNGLTLTGLPHGLYALSTLAAVEANLQAPCFAAGTRIRTPTGQSAVEALRPGDMVMLATGGEAQVIWTGHRRVDCRRHPRPQDVLPVHIRRGAFAPGQPNRELVLSPDHAIWHDGGLIPVRYLLNGVTIFQRDTDFATYWHVELARHAVLLAEGLPCESYLDTGNRSAFADAGTVTMLHPNFARTVWDAKACGELVLEGPELVAAKAALLARAVKAGNALTSDPRLHVLVDGHETPVEIAGPNWHLRIPPGASRLHLVSDTWVPAYARANETDTRVLGAGVGRIWLDGREVSRESPNLCSGWLAPEPGWRWTDGRGEMLLGGARDVLFELAVAGSYWTAPPARLRRKSARPGPG